MSESRPTEVTSRIMAAVKSKNSKAELRLRKALFARGLRYRIHYSGLPGHPDIVFVRSRLTVFVDGDFWHGNAWRLRGMSSFEEQFRFKSNPDFWKAKIERNMARDREVDDQLREDGWHVVQLWESDVLRDVERCVAWIMRVLKETDLSDNHAPQTDKTATPLADDPSHLLM